MKNLKGASLRKRSRMYPIYRTNATHKKSSRTFLNEVFAYCFRRCSRVQTLASTVNRPNGNRGDRKTTYARESREEAD